MPIDRQRGETTPMDARLELDILPQPNDTTCGPTCLHAIYRFHGDALPLSQVIEESHALEGGGTLAVFLGLHALRRGYHARIYTYNLQLFDPTWFVIPTVDIQAKLEAQRLHRRDPKLQLASSAYLDFLRLGGTLHFEDLTTGLIRRYLRRGVPILTGLSATYLYRTAREFGPRSDFDDVRGEPAGHFVVLSGYESEGRIVRIADPLHPNPMAPSQIYTVNIDRVMGAILLGIITYDANLLIIEPRKGSKAASP